MDQPPLYGYHGFDGGDGSSGGSGLGGVGTDASPEARWLAERSAAAGYIVIVISALFSGQGKMRSYAFACPPKPRGRNNLFLVEAYSVGGGALYRWRRRREKWKLAQIVRKCNK